jgi:hypothetical protein
LKPGVPNATTKQNNNCRDNKDFSKRRDCTLVCVPNGEAKQINKALMIWFMVFNATFNNISDISWRSVLLVEEIGVPGENPRPAASH